MAKQKELNMHIMDVVITYLYGSLKNDICMKILVGFKMFEAYNWWKWKDLNKLCLYRENIEPKRNNCWKHLLLFNELTSMMSIDTDVIRLSGIDTIQA